MVDGAGRARLTRSWLEEWGDLIVACGLIILCLPLMILVAIAVKCGSRGPILVWEKRSSPRGQQFWALKFRTTVFEPKEGSYDEPRTTLVGGMLCFLRLNVLPQLVNVLRREMTCFPADPDHTFFLE